MEKFKLILSIILLCVLMSGLVVGYIVLSDNRPDSSFVSKTKVYEILVDDEIKVYAGIDNYVTPYLVNKNGVVETARFDYKCSSNLVNIGFDGLINVSEIPDGDVSVTITDRNTGATKDVKLVFVNQLETILGILAPDGSLISDGQTLLLGDSYSLRVVTEPAGASIGDKCRIVTKDSLGVEKKVFNISYEGDTVKIEAVGLGKGQAFIEILSDGGRVLYSSEFSFNVTVSDQNLADMILSGLGEELASHNELSTLSEITINSSVSDLAGLDLLPSLKKINIKGDSVASLDNKPTDCTYRVPEARFGDYYGHEEWADFKDKLIPGDDKMSGKYVIYHSDKITELAHSKIHYGYQLYKYEAAGYVNLGWIDKDGNPVTSEGVQTSTADCIHVYAVWKPIEYKIVYNIPDYEITLTDVWDYETNKPMRGIDEFDILIKKAGYRFVGWTDVFSTAVKYLDGESYSQLTSEQDKIINLYDVWEPITYTIKFDTTEDMTPIEDVSAQYGKFYTLPTASREGYKFVSWRTQDGTLLQAGVNDKNLTAVDGAELILTPVFEQISYKVTFDLDGGHSLSDINMVTGFEVTLKYSEQYMLPALVKEGYAVYTWLCLENNKIYASDDTLYREFASECSVTLKAVWTAATYTVVYDLDGGQFEGDEATIAYRYWNDGQTLLLPTKMGYYFMGWLDEASGTTYLPDEEIWSGNLISSTEENGKAINLKALWQPYIIDVILNPDGGTIDTESIQVEFGSPYGDIPTPEKLGYSLVGWSLGDGVLVNSTTIVFIDESHTLTAVWVENIYDVYFDSDGGSFISSISVFFNFPYGYLPTPTRENEQVDDGYYSFTFLGWYYGDVEIKEDTRVFVPDNHTLVAKWDKEWHGSCLVKGTPIMLADGSYAPIESLSIGDLIMTFDHATGRYVASPIAFTFYDYSEINVITLRFDNGAVLQMANGGHGVFDTTLNKYVLITPTKVDEFVGHKFSFLSAQGDGYEQSQTTLLSYEITTELVERYDLATANQLNHIANGVLACSDALVGFCNVFEFNEDATYDIDRMNSDIEKYGLFTYEEWSDYVSYEEFVLFNGEYFKIAMEKGLVSREELMGLIYSINK